MPSDSNTTRIARCLCGSLGVIARSEPVSAYLCACRNCQIKSGSAFTYAAVFSEGDVTITGAHNPFRYTGESGRWIENRFCPGCGVAVFFYSEGLAGMVGIAAGCIADGAGTAHDMPLMPKRMYWAERKRSWLPVPDGVEEVGRQ